MAKQRLDLTLPKECIDYVKAEGRKTRRSPAFVVEQCIMFAKAHGLDVNCGQAREMADSIEALR